MGRGKVYKSSYCADQPSVAPLEGVQCFRGTVLWPGGSGKSPKLSTLPVGTENHSSLNLLNNSWRMFCPPYFEMGKQRPRGPGTCSSQGRKRPHPGLLCSRVSPFLCSSGSYGVRNGPPLSGSMFYSENSSMIKDFKKVISTPSRRVIQHISSTSRALRGPAARLLQEHFPLLLDH